MTCSWRSLPQEVLAGGHPWEDAPRVSSFMTERGRCPLLSLVDLSSLSQDTEMGEHPKPLRKRLARGRGHVAAEAQAPGGSIQCPSQRTALTHTCTPPTRLDGALFWEAE